MTALLEVNPGGHGATVPTDSRAILTWPMDAKVLPTELLFSPPVSNQHVWHAMVDLHSYGLYRSFRKLFAYRVAPTITANVILVNHCTDMNPVSSRRATTNTIDRSCHWSTQRFPEILVLLISVTLHLYRYRRVPASRSLPMPWNLYQFARDIPVLIKEKHQKPSRYTRFSFSALRIIFPRTFCHTRFMKANRMHLICAPGSVYTHD